MSVHAILQPQRFERIAFFICPTTIPFSPPLIKFDWSQLQVGANSSGSAGRQGLLRISASLAWGWEVVTAGASRLRGGAVFSLAIHGCHRYGHDGFWIYWGGYAFVCSSIGFLEKKASIIRFTSRFIIGAVVRR